MRSKMFLAANIISSIYTTVLLWTLVGLTILNAGGESIINTVGGFFEATFKLISIDLAIRNYLYVLAVTLFVHNGLFIIGCIFSWIAYTTSKESLATVATIIYLIGTICSPICLVFGIPVVILTFIGAGNQKKINKTT